MFTHLRLTRGALALAFIFAATACGGDDGGMDGGPRDSASPGEHASLLNDGGSDGGEDAGPPPPATCGNGRLDEGELCDGEFLRSATCESVIGTPGTLACAANCLAYDERGCECSPRACEPLDCGSIDDGCGDAVDCGEDCPGALSCGGAGAENRCGRACDDDACPAGTACDADGLCALSGGALELNFDYRVVTFAVELGGSAAPDCEETRIQVSLPDDPAFDRELTLDCTGSHGTAQMALTPGQYDLIPLVPSRRRLRTRHFVVPEADVTIPVPLNLHAVSGRVLHNGEAPERDPICRGSRTPTGTLTFDPDPSSSGRSITASVDCRAGFVFGPVVLEDGPHQVQLVAEGTEYAVVNIGTWRLDMGETTIAGDDSDLEFNLRTYGIEGRFTVGGRPLPGCQEGEATVRLATTGFNQSRYAYTCGSDGALLLDMNLPVGVDVSTFQVRGRGNWSDSFEALDADTVNLDLPGAFVEVSGPLLENGDPIPCAAGSTTVSFAGEDASARVEAECVDGALVVPRSPIPAGTVSGFAGQRPFSLEAVADRLHTPIAVADSGRLTGTIALPPFADCEREFFDLETDSEAQLRTTLDCTGAYEDVRVAVGDWPIRFAANSLDPAALEVVTVRGGEETRFDATVPFVAEGAVRFRFLYDGMPIADVDQVRVFANRVFLEADSHVAPLPLHTPLGQRDVRWTVRTPAGSAHWERDRVAMPEGGDVTLDVSPVFTGGTVRVSGVTVSSGCTRLGRIQIGNASGEVDCAGRFGPLALASGPAAVAFEPDFGALSRATAHESAGPVLLVP